MLKGSSRTVAGTSNIGTASCLGRCNWALVTGFCPHTGDKARLGGRVVAADPAAARTKHPPSVSAHPRAPRPPPRKLQYKP